VSQRDVGSLPLVEQIVAREHFLSGARSAARLHCAAASGTFVRRKDMCYSVTGVGRGER